MNKIKYTINFEIGPFDSCDKERGENMATDLVVISADHGETEGVAISVNSIGSKDGKNIDSDKLFFMWASVGKIILKSTTLGCVSRQIVDGMMRVYEVGMSRILSTKGKVV